MKSFSESPHRKRVVSFSRTLVKAMRILKYLIDVAVQ